MATLRIQNLSFAVSPCPPKNWEVWLTIAEQIGAFEPMAKTKTCCQLQSASNSFQPYDTKRVDPIQQLVASNVPDSTTGYAHVDMYRCTSQFNV